MKDIDNKQAFIDYLEDLPEKGNAYPDLQYDVPYDISPKEFIKLNTGTISFDGYDKFYLLFHPDTNEVFLGDMNLGGHGAMCRIVKIHREDLFTKQSLLKEWYEDYSRKMWM